MQGTELKTVAAKGRHHGHPEVHHPPHCRGPARETKRCHAQIRYIPYPVVNLIFDKPVFNQWYDTWCPGNTFTDFIVADWVVRDQPG